ncbi:MAG: DUF1016 N-terminal domain-containing protein [Chloroflexota bacterium]
MTSKRLVTDIQHIIRAARQKSYAAVNFAMVEAYWQIGRRIVNEEQRGKNRAEYGAQLIKSLSKSLTDEFGKGFSVPNLKSFRQFFLTFPDVEIGYTLCSQLSWSHCRLIMRVDNPRAREYYLKEAAEQTWSVRTLERNIHTLYYERLLTSRDKKSMLAQEANFEKQDIKDFIKDPYVLEFLQLPEDPMASEEEIETAIITKLQARRNCKPSWNARNDWRSGNSQGNTGRRKEPHSKSRGSDPNFLIPRSPGDWSTNGVKFGTTMTNQLIVLQPFLSYNRDI